jgi:hypothetical protein
MSVSSVLNNAAKIIGAVAAGTEVYKNSGPYSQFPKKETNLEQLAEIQVEADERRKRNYLIIGGGALAALAVIMLARRGR